MTQAALGMSGRLALGRYRVVRELARGGMGMVYLGRVEGAAGFSKPVVIKRVLSQVDENKNARAQFIREARLLSELHHPNIVGVIDFGEEDDGYLMILEYVHGFHVGQWLRYSTLRGERFHWEFALLIVARVLAALQYAHNRIGADGKKNPIIHRDVSPGNVLIDLQGSVRLLDFGIARSEHDDESKTQSGVVKGKLPYIAPEIYRSADASVVSDVYSTAVMLYQLLSGYNPFSAKDMSAIIGRVLGHQPPAISTLRDDVPEPLGAVLAKAMDKDPAKRYQSAQEFAAALMALVSCPEAELAEQMRAVVEIEFSDEMADVLDVASLSSLDAAWRASAEDPAAVVSLQRSSMPPADTTHTAVTTEMPISGALPRSLHELETLVAPITAQAHAERMRAAIPLSSRIEATTESESFADRRSSDLAYRTGSGAHTINQASNSRSMLAILLGAFLVAGAVVAAALLLRDSNEQTTPKQPRFLVVERPSAAPAPVQTNQVEPESNPQELDSPSLAHVQDSPGQQPALVETGPSDQPAPSGTRKAAPLTEAEQVTSAFGKRQAAVQACFSQSASGISGTPQLSVRFKIAESGAVESAAISPASVGSTALGACILSVARGTKFPALGKSLAFSIPITAQVVKK